MQQATHSASHPDAVSMKSYFVTTKYDTFGFIEHLALLGAMSIFWGLLVFIALATAL